MNKQYPYDVPGNYTFDAGKIEVAGGTAKLRDGFWEQGASVGSYVRGAIGYNGKLYAVTFNVNYKVKVFENGIWSDSFVNLEGEVIGGSSDTRLAEYNGKLYTGAVSYDVGTNTYTTWLYAFDGVAWSKELSFSGNKGLGLIVYNSKLIISTSYPNETYTYDGSTLSTSLGFTITKGRQIVHSNILYFMDGDYSIRSYDGISDVNVAGLVNRYTTMESHNGDLYFVDISDRFYRYDGINLNYITQLDSYNMVSFNGKLYVVTLGGLFIYDEITSFDLIETGYTKDEALGVPTMFDSKLYWFVNSSGYFQVEFLTSGYNGNKITIEPSSLFSPGDSISWDIFSEILGAGNQGSVGYNLYKGDKTNKYYWNGSAWVTGGSSSNYNNAATVQANLTSFDAPPTAIGYVAYLISDGAQAVEIDSNDIAYTTNVAPLVNAGANKNVKDNLFLAPFSDATFNDPDGVIIKAEYKVIGEVDAWTEISQGSYGSLLEAVQSFQYQFTGAGNKTVQLQVTDDSSVPNGTQQSQLTVDVQKYNVTIEVYDQYGRELSELLVQQTAIEGYVARNSPFILQYAYSSDPGEVVIKKEGYGISLRSVDIADYTKNVVVSPGGDSTQLTDIIPDIDDVPKHNPNMAEAISFLYRYFRLRRGRKWWNMKRFIIRG